MFVLVPVLNFPDTWYVALVCNRVAYRRIP